MYMYTIMTAISDFSATTRLKKERPKHPYTLLKQTTVYVIAVLIIR